MNTELREAHLNAIEEEARAMAEGLYDALCTEYENQYGPTSDSTQMIVQDIVQMEVTKHKLLEDIKKRGVVEEFRNGRQHFWRENKSIQAARALMDQQRRHLGELKLTQAAMKFGPDALQDEFTAF